MKLYYSKGACSLAVRIIINELNLPCEYEAVNLGTKQTETGIDYYSINPKGSVPVIQLEDGAILTELAVILQYLADTSHAEQLLPHVGDFKRYRILEWVNFVSTELHKGCGPLFNPKVPQELKDSLFIPLLKSKLMHVDHFLEKHKYLGGDHFALPDAYIFVILRWLIHFKFNLNDWPHIARYFEQLQKQKSILKSVEEEGLKMVPGG